MPRDTAADRPRPEMPIVLLMLGMLAGCGPSDEAVRAAGGDPARGWAAIQRVGCGVCHVIPGVHGPDGLVGPPLSGLTSRMTLAGSLPNRPSVLAQLVRDAPSLVPRTAMPEMPLDAQEARDVAADLYSLR
jgi:mono/diheme cytochrome c family protein